VRSARLVPLCLTLAILVAMAAGCTAGPPQPSAPAEQHSVPRPGLRVMTWNLQRGQAVTGRIAPADMGPFAARIAANRADVVGLQEVTREQAEAIAGRLGWAAPRFVETKNPCPGFPPPLPATCVPFGNAILSHLPTGASKQWSLPPSRLERSLEDRVLLRTEIVFGGSKVLVYVSHLASNATASEREAQVEAVLSLIDEDEDEDENDEGGGAAAAAGGGGLGPVLLGDFNAEPDTDAVALVTDRFVDAWADVRDAEPGFTSNPTLELNRRIDYVFVDQESRFRPTEVSVDPEVLSDHLPVVAELA
jgi:endonuclease/exonuclease/phosphatase family metal-dependent hydrolase